MKQVILPIALLLGSTGFACAQSVSTATPASGWQAGDIAVRLAVADVTPLNGGSTIDGIGGKVGIDSYQQPEVDLSYFFTDALSVQLIATATRHEITANNTSLTALLGNKIDLASTYVLPPAITLQYHFLPHAVVSPYVGAGIDFIWPFDTQPNEFKLGNAQVIQKVGLSNMVGPVFNVGADYNISGPWFLNVDYKQIINHVDARIHTVLGLVKARDNLDPAVFSVGITYKF